MDKFDYIIIIIIITIIFIYFVFSRHDITSRKNEDEMKIKNKNNQPMKGGAIIINEQSIPYCEKLFATKNDVEYFNSVLEDENTYIISLIPFSWGIPCIPGLSNISDSWFYCYCIMNSEIYTGYPEYVLRVNLIRYIVNNNIMMNPEFIKKYIESVGVAIQNGDPNNPFEDTNSLNDALILTLSQEGISEIDDISNDQIIIDLFNVSESITVGELNEMLIQCYNDILTNTMDILDNSPDNSSGYDIHVKTLKLLKTIIETNPYVPNPEMISTFREKACMYLVNVQHFNYAADLLRTIIETYPYVPDPNMVEASGKIADQVLKDLEDLVNVHHFNYAAALLRTIIETYSNVPKFVMQSTPENIAEKALGGLEDLEDDYHFNYAAELLRTIIKTYPYDLELDTISTFIDITGNALDNLNNDNRFTSAIYSLQTIIETYPYVPDLDISSIIKGIADKVLKGLEDLESKELLGNTYCFIGAVYLLQTIIETYPYDVDSEMLSAFKDIAFLNIEDDNYFNHVVDLLQTIIETCSDIEDLQPIVYDISVSSMDCLINIISDRGNDTNALSYTIALFQSIISVFDDTTEYISLETPPVVDVPNNTLGLPEDYYQLLNTPPNVEYTNIEEPIYDVGPIPELQNIAEISDILKSSVIEYSPEALVEMIENNEAIDEAGEQPVDIQDKTNVVNYVALYVYYILLNSILPQFYFDDNLTPNIVDLLGTIIASYSPISMEEIINDCAPLQMVNDVIQTHMSDIVSRSVSLINDKNPDDIDPDDPYLFITIVNLLQTIISTYSEAEEVAGAAEAVAEVIFKGFLNITAIFIPVANLLKTIIDKYPEHKWIQTEEAAEEIMTTVANMATEAAKALMTTVANMATEEDINNHNEVDKLLCLRIMESACNLISCINEDIDKDNNEDQ